MPTDVRASGADFVASGAQKWMLGPIGCGLLYVRAGLLAELDVPLAGWTSVKYPENFELRELDFANEMTRFEPGLPNLLSIAGLNESLRELKTLGWEMVFERIREHVAYLTAALEAQGIATLAGSEGRAGIVSFDLPRGMDPRETGQRLEKAGVSVTLRDGYIRVSPHFYTTRGEIDRFLEVVDLARGRAQVPVGVASAALRPSETAAAPRWVLLTGSTGILGGHLARELARRGFAITLVARDPKLLEKQRAELSALGAAVDLHVADFTDEKAVAGLLDELAAAGPRYHALINAAGMVETEPFVSLDSRAVEQMFRVNVLTPARLIRLFLTGIRTPEALGVLNIVSSSARCGAPLLAAYGASNAALWTLSETIDREVQSEGLVITTFVAPAMHSRMQKRIGRIALRYFKMSGQFDYDHADLVARRAIDALLARRRFVINRANRLKILLNDLFPQMIDRKIAQVWKQ